MIKGLYDRILGHGYVYDKLRPFFLGGFDFSEVYGWLGAEPSDILVDVGCGTGYALEYIKSFQSYHGFDVDGAALDVHKRKNPLSNIALYARTLGSSDVLAIRPTKTIAMGLLHHLTDAETTTLLRDLALGGTVKRIITLDVAFQRGRWMNNLLARMDRGRFVRTEEGYKKLISESPFRIAREKYIACGNRLASYYATCMEPK